MLERQRILPPRDHRPKARGEIRKRLLLVSAVFPFPGTSGQQERVRNKLIAFRREFHVTFLGRAQPEEHHEIRRRLLEHCDDVVLLPSRYRGDQPLRRAIYRVLGELYAWAKGLKFSNFLVDRLEFTPARIAGALADRVFDVAVFEYWHAQRARHYLQQRGLPCVLDMHDILWKSRDRQLAAGPLPRWLRSRQVAAYRRREEASWPRFDALITINSDEHTFVRERLPAGFPLLYAPMGVNMDIWAFGPCLAKPPRVAYFGGLASPHNQRDALYCHEEILPRVREEMPEVELWLVGSDPPASLSALAETDRRLRVTGFVDDVQKLLRTMTLVLCPWTGTYGFRSRLVQVMALGVPVIASPDAVAGMDLTSGDGIFLAEGAGAMAEAALALLRDPELARQQADSARRVVESRYSFEATYGRLASELATWTAGADSSQEPIRGPEV